MMVIASEYFDLRLSEIFTPSALVWKVTLTGRLSAARRSVSAMVLRDATVLHDSAAAAGEAAAIAASRESSMRIFM
jgi:hypothetical protein